MSKVKLFAALVTSLGLIVAVCAAAKLPDEGRRFPTTTGVALAALFVASAGLIAWRIADRQSQADDAAAGDDIAAADEVRNPLLLVEQLQLPLQQLCDDASSLDNVALRDRVDQIIDQYVLPFSTARQVILHKLGIRRGAELMIEFALGERLLNRAWSAAADGHLPEAVASLEEVREAFAAVKSS